MNRLMIAAACAAALAAPATALDLAASLTGPIATAQGQGMLKFKERVEALTNGEITVTVFPDAQLGGIGSESFEMMEAGQIALIADSPGFLAEYVPEVQQLVVPFVFRDFDHWEAVLTGPVGEDIARQVREETDAIVLGYFGGSIRNLVSSRPVADLSDIAGLRLRIQPAEVQTTAWSALGAIPTVMAYNEIYSGLQLGVVDGLENEAEWVLRMKFYEQAEYYVQTEHEYVTRLFLLSEKLFDRMTPSQQEAVLQAGREAAAFQRALERENDAASKRELAETHGVAIVEVDKAEVQRIVGEAMAPVVAKLALGDAVARIRAQ